MPSYQVDLASGTRLIGGEMAGWSDLTAQSSAGAVTCLLDPVLRAATSAPRILLLGPRASQLLEDLPVDAEVDVLVRGLGDARHLAALSGLRARGAIHCGSLDRFAPQERYDVIVSLDGPAVLMSPDSPGIGHAALVRLLGTWLRAEGTLVAAVSNELGFDTQFRLNVRESLDADDQWHRGATGFDLRALYHRELDGALESAGLRPLSVYAGFPAADSLSLLVGRESADDPAVSTTAASLAARMEQSHFSREPSLVDAYGLALRLFDSGLTFEFAPLWLVVARPTGSDHEVDGAAQAGSPPPARSATRSLPSLPALVATEDSGRPVWRGVTTVERDDDRWVHRVRPVAGTAEMRERRVVRDYTEMGGAAPEGTPLEALLRQACATGSIIRVRGLVQRYAAWLRDVRSWPADAAGVRVFAVPSNVVVSGDELACFDLTWRWTEELDDDVVLVRGLRDFARRLLRSGAEHPWNPDISPDALAQTLAAMAGIEWDPALVEVVAGVEAELDVVVHGGDATYEGASYASNLESGSSQFAHAGARGYREALAASGRMAQALHERDGQVKWLEATLRARDARVGDLDRTLDAVRGSASFRIGRFLTWPVRWPVSVVASTSRRLALSLLPPGAPGRLRKLAQRLSR